MFSLFGFINNGQFHFSSRTNAFLTIVHLSTPTGSDYLTFTGMCNMELDLTCIV